MVSVLLFIEVLLYLLMTYIMLIKHTAICVVVSNLISAIIVFIYCILQAPDLAITEAVIGTATSTILFALTLLYINKLPTIENKNDTLSIDIRQRIVVFICCSILCFLLIYTIQNLPRIPGWESTDYPKISSLYVKNAIKDFGFSSIVTAVVAGYRAFDTMFENVVIFTGCYGFYVLLTMDKDTSKQNNNELNKKIETISVVNK